MDVEYKLYNFYERINNSRLYCLYNGVKTLVFGQKEQAILGPAFVVKGYFVASSGNVTDEIIKEYIQNQD